MKSLVLLAAVLALAQAPAPTKAEQLQDAARKGDAAAVKQLLDSGLDVNTKFRYNAFSASLVAADGKIYCSSEDGDVYVVKAGPAFELLAKNAMGETLMATPAVSDGLIIFRGSKNVYAIKPR